MEHKKDQQASELARKRWQAVPPEQRSVMARAASRARWDAEDDGLPRATHAGELAFGDLRIPCYVLNDGRRVLIQTALVQTLGMAKGSNSALGGDRLANFASGKTINPFISENLAAGIRSPLRFRTNRGAVAHGYEATILADICEAVLMARQAKVLQKQQEHIAVQCEILVRAFSRVGVVALVDEATGYQADRARDALARILEQFIAHDLRKWMKTFPSDFYKEMFRLKGWQFDPLKVERPGVVGRYTNDLVYDRLAPGVREELQRLTPRDEKGRLKHKLHQHLSEDVGHPRLREHLTAVVALMRAASSWGGFTRAMDRAFPRPGITLPLALGDDTGSITPTC